MTTISNSLEAEMLEMKGYLANLVQSLTSMSTTLNQTKTIAQAAQQMATEARDNVISFQQTNVDSGSTIQASLAVRSVAQHPNSDIIMDGTQIAQTSAPRLRKMDVSPPTFEGAIDGIKLNGFLFQFDSYYRQKGYDLQEHDNLLCYELNQCVRKSALVWYERYMTDSNTRWSVSFVSRTFNDKILNQVLTLKQSGGYRGYRGYAAKFRELQRIVKLDEQTATNLLVNGLSDMQMKRAVQRKQPTTLSAGFLETWKNESRWRKTDQQASGTGGIIAHGKQPVVTLCSRWQRGRHREEDCWIKYPAKKPRNLMQKQDLHKKIYALLETLCSKQDICIPNSNFIDSCATIDGQTDGGDTQTIVTITLYLDDFPPYTNDFLVIDVPEEQGILLGMPWLRKENPDIDWVTERIQPRRVNDGEKEKLTSGFYSVHKGMTKCIGDKQFRRMLEKPKDIEFVFVIRAKTKKEKADE
ncbi:Hypothetical protein PHPALM_15180 [Phytophthora palmivora]|uniref:Retrotransposon gag domain-containing protein n=1 Tax=Phytophthora palmivora TaxID=4796 RepID=A0A2P4XSW4_9STRA|nr:Hypothetical protein PHPALM_15180 [Phytophthora palmivora]